jgi:uncharacterized C2H2 Zn-finger protein
VSNNQAYLKQVYGNVQPEPVSENDFKEKIVIKQEPDHFWSESVEIFECDLKTEQELDSSSSSSEGQQSSGESEEEAPVKAKRKRRKRPYKSNKTTAEREEEALRREMEDIFIRERVKLACDVCAKPARTFCELVQHHRAAHELPGYFKCCQMKIFRKCELIEHIKWHENPDYFKCSSCESTFKTKKSLQNHIDLAHLSDDKKPFKCTKCSKSFAREYQLKKHISQHEKVSCPECDRKLANKECLKQHLFQVHSTGATMVCDMCAKIFKTKVAFDKHMNLHLGLTTPKIQCHICEKWFTDNVCLKLHIRTQHLEMGQEFFCNVCGKKAPNSNALKRHKEIHLEEKHQCTFCDRKFKRPVALKVILLN